MDIFNRNKSNGESQSPVGVKRLLWDGTSIENFMEKVDIDLENCVSDVINNLGCDRSELVITGIGKSIKLLEGGEIFLTTGHIVEIPRLGRTLATNASAT